VTEISTIDGACPTVESLQDWALKYARMGWPVLPLAPRDKVPLTTNGLKDATTDPQTIRKWWDRTPDANIGIRTGSGSGFFALDVDSKSDGLASLDEMITTHGMLPDSPESLTGGGGKHFLFACPDHCVANSVGKVGPGLDIRGERGYIVAPPSIHRSGRTYEWEVSNSPEQIPIAPAPEWLLKAIDRTYPNGRGPITPPDRIAAGARNDTLFRIGCSLREQFGCGEMEIFALLSKMNAERCADDCGNPSPLPDPEIRKISRGIVKQYRAGSTSLRTSPKRNPSPKDRARPTVHLEGGELHRIVDEAEAALLESNKHEIFQRGGVLVRVVRLESPSSCRGIKRDRGSLVIHPVELPSMAEKMTESATFTILDKRSHSWKPMDCPDRVAKTYMARAGSWKVSTLTGIIEAPTLRSDGSILSTKGYDESTGLFLDPGREGFGEIRDKPTREDAEAAMALILDVLRDFPFVADSDRSAAVSAILSGLIRKSLKTVPLHAFRAPKMRSGKTLLADCASLFATGRPCSVLSQSSSPEEERKRLLAILIAGDPVTCYDNIDRPFGGAAISQALTQETITDRLLGASKTVTAPTNTLFLATGNNLVFEGDITSRVVPCDIDPEQERPEERSFERNLYEYIPDHRGRLVTAGLTVLRAFHVAGRPDQGLPGWGGFEEWSNWVRGAIVWLGLADPAAGRSKIEEVDPVRTGLRDLYEAWADTLGTDPVTARQVIKAAEDPEAEELQTAVSEVACNRQGKMSSRALGKFLSSNEKRIEDGMRIERSGKRQGAVLWKLVQMTTESTGEFGEFSEFVLSETR